MSKYIINDTTLTGIGDAIRAKGGTSELIPVSELATAITNLPSGGGSEDCNGHHIPDEALTLSGDCSNIFSSSKLSWYLQEITNSKNITNCTSMFSNSYMTEIPFPINCSGNTHCNQMFYYCQSLTTAPTMTINDNYAPNFSNMFEDCERLINIDYNFFNNMATEAQWDYWNSMASNGGTQSLFRNCKSLRVHPDLKHLSQASSDSYGRLRQMFYGCYSLDEIIGFPINLTTLTYNCFYNNTDYCYRIKNFTLATNNGAPYSFAWSGQTIDLSVYVGYGQYAYNFTGYNSGITADKQVSDDTTYQALKDDPDWFAVDIAYSRYNHDSAVNTINSLPDTSTSGGTNTIKFKGVSGSATDGGAINTLTEEEIAVATAKGWTVSLV